jgi:hypothetical protein
MFSTKNPNRPGLQSFRIFVFLALTILIVQPMSSLAADSVATAGAPASTTLSGSAKHSQPLKSLVKLTAPTKSPRTGAIQNARQVQYSGPRVIYIPNAPVSLFRRHQLNLPIPLLPLLPAQTAQVQPSAKPSAEIKSEATGIMTWVPGYESAIVSHAQPLSAQPELHGALRGEQMPALVPQFRSTPRLLTELLQPKEKRSANWDEWYKRVCRTVYDQWLLDDSGAGKVCVHVTVWSSRDLACKIDSFSPTAGTTRDTVRESAFREGALRAVRSLDRCMVLEFPAQFNEAKMDFDLDISRAVDGRFGCQVVVAPGAENPVAAIR